MNRIILENAEDETGVLLNLGSAEDEKEDTTRNMKFHHQKIILKSSDDVSYHSILSVIWSQ